MKLQLRYSTVVSTLALVVALTGVGAQAAGVFVTSKQIRNGTILSQDIHKNGVRSSDLKTGAVGSADLKTGAVQSVDIGTGEVRPEDVSLPAPVQLREPAGDVSTVEVGDEFALIDTVGTHNKQDPASLLKVDWTGTVRGSFSSCVFQLRVDGQPSGSDTGMVYASSGETLSVSATALFQGLVPGAHTVEVWARSLAGGGIPHPCTVGPAGPGIGQTFVIGEEIV